MNNYFENAPIQTKEQWLYHLKKLPCRFYALVYNFNYHGKIEVHIEKGYLGVFMNMVGKYVPACTLYIVVEH